MARVRLEMMCVEICIFIVIFKSLGAEATFRGNYLGCLFSADVCSEYEICVDDGLFGACKDFADTLEVKPIRLTREQVTELEENMQHLIDNGYTWHHEYAQCLVKHYVTEYTRGSINVAYPSKCAKQESERKLENFERKLGQKTLNYEGSRGELIDNRLEDEFDDRREREEEEEFREFLKQFTDEELGNVKNFLMMESNSQSDNDSVVKKSPLSTKTSVVVHFHPADDDSQISAEQGLQNNNLLSTANFPNFHKVEENKLKTDEEGIESSMSLASSSPEDAEDERLEARTLQPIASPAVHYTRPFYKYFMAHVNSLPGMNHNNYGGTNQLFSKDGVVKTEPIEHSRMSRNRQKYLVTMYVLCGFVVVATFLAVVLYFVRRRSRFREKISRWANKDRQDSTGDYQDLCRHHMQSRLSEKLIDSPTSLMGRQNKAVLPDSQSPPTATRKDHSNTRTSSTNSSTSSWAEEPVNSNMDISTGHLILSYMEDHMKNKDRLQKEWEDICSNDGEPCSIVAGIEPVNMRKNRCTDILPYEHSRIKLNPTNNISGSDYINANYITDHDPRNPAYIATQGPLPHTVADFWQMIWEQNSVVIVNLTKLWENSSSICHRYWPEEGTDLYHIYEVQLISEHNLCEDFVVRSLFLKNLQVSETRTITQFHFLTWPDHEVPASTKILLDFRRKVNKSYRGRSSPMVVHCSDGAGRTGTYCLIDMSLNRLSKGAKEIDIAAALEHLRDQRVNMVRTKEQFEFALTAVAEEVHAVLNFVQP